MICMNCGAMARATDRHCPNCGSPLAGGDPRPVTEAYVPSSTLRSRSRRGILRLRWLLPAIVIAVIAVIAITSGGEGKEVPEDPSSPGYSLVRDLKSRGEIDSFKAVEPDEGWSIQYSVDGGDAILRFRGDELEYEVRKAADELEDAIKAAAVRAGYGPA